jgi:peptidoglycan/xylan/chitin deacetylase (PgdA/CDA1 family)
MSGHSAVFLMYHELQIAGRPLCCSDLGYARYAISEPEFRAQMQHLKEARIRGLSVSQAVEFPEETSVAITFDDGTETDLLGAAPILRQAGFNATFYVTCGWLGRRGYLSVSQLNELSNQGFEIGCHSMTHAYLSDLDDRALRFEIVDAKAKLEQMIGKVIQHFSCPGGRYDNRVAEVARIAGYKTVSTSRIRANDRDTSPFALGRVAILSGLPIATFSAICTGEALPRLRAQSLLRGAAKQLLGSALYDRMRMLLLDLRHATR